MFCDREILFNYESERRGETFVTRKISLAAARISQGLQDCLYLGNLDLLRDWGYVRALDDSKCSLPYNCTDSLSYHK